MIKVVHTFNEVANAFFSIHGSNKDNENSISTFRKARELAKNNGFLESVDRKNSSIVFSRMNNKEDGVSSRDRIKIMLGGSTFVVEYYQIVW